MWAARAKARRRSGSVPCLDIDAQVVGRLIPQHRRARLDRLDRAADRRQRLVVDVDPFGHISGRGDRFGHDHRYAFADETRFFDR